MENMPFEKMEIIEPIKKSKLTAGYGREYPIKITNLISPSSFYFKLENLMGTMEMDISEILKAAAAELQPTYPTGYVPSERETIMVYVTEWSRWIRAEVDEIINNPLDPRFVVWCLDYGVALFMHSTNLLPLDGQLLADFPNETIFHGGLAKCIPSVKDFGFFGKHRELDWDEQDKKTMQNLIWNAAEMRFLPLRRNGDENGHLQVFGDIKLDKYDKDEGDMAKELAQHGKAEVIEEIIPTIIDNMKSMKKKRHEGYENNDRFDIMALSKPFNDVPPVERRYDDDDQVYDRILDWNNDNKSVAKMEEWKQFRDFEKTIKELKEGNCLLPRIGLLRGSRYRSNLSINGSSTSSIMGSCSNFTSDDKDVVTDDKTSSVAGSSRKLFLNSLKPQSVMSNGKVAAKKKTVYMPAGAERDLMEFLSIQE